VFVLLVVALGALFPARGEAQQVTRSDSAAIFLDAARMLDARGQGAAADAIYQLILERFPDTFAADAARSRVRVPVTDRISTSSGAVELKVWSTLYGLWLGVAVPAAFGAEGSEAYGVGLLVGGPVGFLVGQGLARSGSLSDAQARAVTFGGTWGTWQGFGWSRVLDLGEGFECDGDLCVSDGGAEETFAAMVVGGIGGIAVGSVLSRKNITPGIASTVSFSALWGTWFGTAAGVLIDAEDDGLLAASLIGGDAGLVTAAILAPRWNMSRNRARLISIAGVIGGLAGGGIDLIVRPDDEKAAVAIPLAGSIIGLAIGAVTTRSYDARNPGGDENDGAGSALLRLDHGRFSIDMPIPHLAALPHTRNGRADWETGAGLTLFSARF
jgi:hypothetical protein